MGRLLTLLILSLPAIASDAPVIHFYRYHLSFGQAVHTSVFCDGSRVARIQNGRVFTAALEPGTHAITSDSKQIGFEVNATPGNDIFVRIDFVSNGPMMGMRPNPVLVSPEQGRYEIKQLKPLDAKYVVSKTCP